MHLVTRVIRVTVACLFAGACGAWWWRSRSVAGAAAATPTLTLGLAVDTPLPFLHAFLASHRAHLPPGAGHRLVLLTDGLRLGREREAALQRDYDARFVPRTVWAGWLAPQQHAHHPSSYRWSLFRHFLRRAEPADAKAVLLLDVRDVVFQADPFARLDTPPTALHVFEEDAAVTVGQCAVNTAWIRSCFDADTAARLAPHPILCSGTTLGAPDAVALYLDRMHAQLSDAACEANGVDQGIHNVLVRRDLVPAASGVRVHFHTNARGPIATMGYMRTADTDYAGRVLNEDGVPYAIVHQYDRFRSYQAWLHRRYAVLEEEGERHWTNSHR